MTIYSHLKEAKSGQVHLPWSVTMVTNFWVAHWHEFYKLVRNRRLLRFATCFFSTKFDKQDSNMVLLGNSKQLNFPRSRQKPQQVPPNICTSSTPYGGFELGVPPNHPFQIISMDFTLQTMHCWVPSFLDTSNRSCWVGRCSRSGWSPWPRSMAMATWIIPGGCFQGFHI